MVVDLVVDAKDGLDEPGQNAYVCLQIPGVTEISAYLGGTLFEQISVAVKPRQGTGLDRSDNLHTADTGHPGL